MVARASMAALIARVRTLIGDPSGTGEVWADTAIQEFLDGRQTVVRYDQLRAAPTLGATVQYLDYYADVGDWEGDAALYDSALALLAPKTSDYQTGHWTFQTSVLPPVYILGKHYDVHAAAADVLEAWAATEKLAYDFTADGASYSRSQRAKALLGLAAEYRKRAGPVRAQQVRDDVTC